MKSIKTIYFLFAAITVLTACQEEQLKKQKTASMLTAIESPNGNYTVAYNELGEVQKVNYTEGGSSFDYNFTWNSDSTVLTRYEYYLNNREQTQVAKFIFDKTDSTIIGYEKTVGTEYNVKYNFGYTDGKLSSLTMIENGETITSTVKTTSISTIIEFSNGRMVSIVYTPNPSPFKLADPITMASLLDKDLAIFNIIAQDEVLSINDSQNDLTVNSMTYTVQNDRLVSFKKDDALFTMKYENIPVK